jgi:prevent-host-death family protein
MRGSSHEGASLRATARSDAGKGLHLDCGYAGLSIVPATYNMHDAKTNLSRLAERAASGEEIVIARNGRPIAKLVSLDRPRTRRRLGLWKGNVWIRDDFDEPLPSELRQSFEGNRA